MGQRPAALLAGAAGHWQWAGRWPQGRQWQCGLGFPGFVVHQSGARRLLPALQCGLHREVSGKALLRGWQALKPALGTADEQQTNQTRRGKDRPGRTKLLPASFSGQRQLHPVSGQRHAHKSRCSHTTTRLSQVQGGGVEVRQLASWIVRSPGSDLGSTVGPAASQVAAAAASDAADCRSLRADHCPTCVTASTPL